MCRPFQYYIDLLIERKSYEGPCACLCVCVCVCECVSVYIPCLGVCLCVCLCVWCVCLCVSVCMCASYAILPLLGSLILAIILFPGNSLEDVGLWVVHN